MNDLSALNWGDRPSRPVIGLTGGIGAGKSQAARLFGSWGADIIDTDVLSHTLTATGGDALPAICAHFGPHALNADGALDRAAMRKRIFEDPAERKVLESILHPSILRAAQNATVATHKPYVIVVVPLLFESTYYTPWISRSLLIDCPEEQQIARVCARGLSALEVAQIMRAQLSRHERRLRAQDIVDNSKTIDALQHQLERLHQRYLALAHSSAKCA